MDNIEILKQEHRQALDELNKLESDLVTIIVNMGNQELMEKFLKWQSQRTLCNEKYINILKSYISNNEKQEP